MLRGWIVANPCARLERLTVVRPTPHILTVAQTAACLRWLSENPRCLAWFALTALAGLRPEEAQRTQWDAINLEEGFIRVEAQTSKKRQRRIVYPRPAALRWLAKAKELASTLPILKNSRKRAQKQLRALLGWPKWKKDCTRHSAASYWLAAEESCCFGKRA